MARPEGSRRSLGTRRDATTLVKGGPLKSEDSPLLAYINDLKAWDIDLTFEDDALTEVARFAEQEKTGARGLISILHKVLIEDMFRLPGKYSGELTVDTSYLKERLP